MIDSAVGSIVGLTSFVLSGVAGLPQTPAGIFGTIFVVFVVLGTLVGVVVIAYMLKNAWVYRDGTGNGDDADVVRPEQGQLPTGSGGGKKLFVSFGISAIIVLSLIVWTYSALLYVEEPPDDHDLTVEVVGEQFAWQFVYPNGHAVYNELRVPNDSQIKLEVRSADVFHNFGIPDYRVKADAMPGHTTDTWFVADEVGTTSAHCYELCGSGHSGMDATVITMEGDAFESWYANTTGSAGGSNATGQADGGNASGGTSHALGGAP